MLASRTKSKCDAVAAAIGGNRVKTAEVDAGQRAAAVRVVPVLQAGYRGQRGAPVPGSDDHGLPAWSAAATTSTPANYEPRDEAHFEYSWQWAYQDRFKAAGLTAILGCGFDPGVTAIFTAYAAKHHFDEIHYLDIVDCKRREPRHGLRHELQPPRSTSAR